MNLRGTADRQQSHNRLCKPLGDIVIAITTPDKITALCGTSYPAFSFTQSKARFSLVLTRAFISRCGGKMFVIETVDTALKRGNIFGIAVRAYFVVNASERSNL